MKAVMLDADSMGSDVSLEPLKGHLVAFASYSQTSPEQVVERLQNQDVVIVNKVRIEDAHMQALPQLKLIAVTATGVNNIDMEAAERHGILVRNVTHYGTATIVQHVFSLILALANNLIAYQQAVKEGRWQAASQFCLMDYPIRELHGATLGIIGYGELGRAVARAADVFGMNVLVGARPGTSPGPRDGVNYLALDELLPEVDVLSLHCLLSESTKNMLDAQALARMKPDALLINTARGGLVDEEALKRALQQGKLGGAGVDVLTEEPPRNGNPLLAEDIPNLIVTPHCAWASRQARQRIIEKTADNIQWFVAREERKVRL